MTPHTQRLERWLGAEQLGLLSSRMMGYHGGEIAIANLPGHVKVHPDGNFSGHIYGAKFASLADVYESAARRARRAVRRMARSQTLHMGFASIPDFLDEVRAGKKQEFLISKAGAGGAGSNISNSLFGVGNAPAAGVAATAAPGGHSPDNTTLGGLGQINPSGGDTLHFAGANIQVTNIGTQLLLMYDRFFACNHDWTVDPRTVTGTPTRYQSTAAKNTFITCHVAVLLPNTSPTYTITYVDQDGNTAEATAAQTGRNSSAVGQFPFAATVGNGWYFPLNAPDTGVRSLTNLDLSAANGSAGTVDVILGKPYVFIPCPNVNQTTLIDGLCASFNPVQITDSSCIAFLELKSGTTAANYAGSISLVAG